ncbi:MAG: hypothetical protein HY335_00770 [Deinococcus sp.]|nr:hypothetical protein [Deinococcus sp.]
MILRKTLWLLGAGTLVLVFTACSVPFMLDLLPLVPSEFVLGNYSQSSTTKDGVATVQGDPRVAQVQSATIDVIIQLSGHTGTGQATLQAFIDNDPNPFDSSCNSDLDTVDIPNQPSQEIMLWVDVPACALTIIAMPGQHYVAARVIFIGAISGDYEITLFKLFGLASAF